MMAWPSMARQRASKRSSGAPIYGWRINSVSRRECAAVCVVQPVAILAGAASEQWSPGRRGRPVRLEAASRVGLFPRLRNRQLVRSTDAIQPGLDIFKRDASDALHLI